MIYFLARNRTLSVIIDEIKNELWMQNPNKIYDEFFSVYTKMQDSSDFYLLKIKTEI